MRVVIAAPLGGRWVRLRVPPAFTVEMAEGPWVVAIEPGETEREPVEPELVVRVAPAETLAADQVTPGPRVQTAVEPATSTSERVDDSDGRLVATPTRPLNT